MNKNEVIDRLINIADTAKYGLPIGFTTIFCKQKGKNFFVEISHNGDMNHTIKNIDKNLLLAKLCTISEFKEIGKVISEDGNPDYLYILTLVIEL